MIRDLILLILTAALLGCEAPDSRLGKLAAVKSARITWYDRFEDKYGAHTASGAHATEGRTVAAHPDFKFGTTLMIPALRPILGSSKFVVEDRGSAVTSRKASNHGEYVFDVYFMAQNKRQGARRMRELGAQLTHADVFTFTR